MQIQVHAGSRTGGGALIETVTGMIEAALSRFAKHLTRVDVHMSDENGSKGGKDKRCVVEAHMEGRKPVAVVENAETMKQAVQGAIDKLVRMHAETMKQAVQGAIDKLVRMLDSTTGKMTAQRRDGARPDVTAD
jgi:ribosome-associated translation inhibitor RaiA